VFTATDTPTSYGKASAFAEAARSAAEDVWITTAAATLPASGSLVVETYFVTPA
jgi:hypothetical protein